MVSRKQQPTLVEDLQRRVTRIASGAHHMLAITKEGFFFKKKMKSFYLYSFSLLKKLINRRSLLLGLWERREIRD